MFECQAFGLVGQRLNCTEGGGVGAVGAVDGVGGVGAVGGMCGVGAVDGHIFGLYCDFCGQRNACFDGRCGETLVVNGLGGCRGSEGRGESVPE